jgi:hypothetical protein
LVIGLLEKGILIDQISKISPSLVAKEEAKMLLASSSNSRVLLYFDE